MNGLTEELDAVVSGAASEYELMVITHLPGQAGMRARHRYWRTRLRHLGESARIDTGVYFQNPEFISIGDRTWIDKNVIILAGRDDSTRRMRFVKNQHFPGEPGTVSIGAYVHIGVGCIISGIEAGVAIGDRCGLSAQCKLYAFSHHYRAPAADRGGWRPAFSPMVRGEEQHLLQGPISIGANTGLALDAVVLPGVHLPEDCFVAVGSVVLPRPYAPNSVLAGNPARPVGPRYPAS